MQSRLIIAVALILGVGLSGCSKFYNKKQTARGARAVGASQNEEVASQGVGETEQFYGSDNASIEDLLQRRTFRFGFDRYDLAGGDMSAINAHAEQLRANPNMMVRIEGHTDERGGREYNVALGEKRAKAVANVLLSNGVSARQIHVVSYGKEKPEAHGSDEEAHSVNRRAIIVYEN